MLQMREAIVEISLLESLLLVGKFASMLFDLDKSLVEDGVAGGL